MNYQYLVRKLLLLVVSLFLVATITFFLMQAAPGDPFMQEQAVPEEIMKSMYAHYGLDQPWYVQYLKYLKGLITWDLGPSFKYEGRTVNDIIREGFPVSLILGIQAIAISLFSGVILGTIAAVKRSRWQDFMAMVIAVIGISVPNFIMATFLQYIFAMKFDLFPVARWGSLAHSILPAFSLAALPTAFIARLTRTNVVEVLEQDYIQTARSKGLCTRKVVTKHVLKNSLLPVITYLAPLCSTILTGSFIVEKIFGIPGLGGWFVTSITNRDYTVIMGVTVFYSALLMLCILVVDILYTFLDPRIKFTKPKLAAE
ncbi:ABC transporter permease [Candidatus Neptunochlamydia vexilliferae]|uniref:Oligopeptide transport system permease protein OppB n=1 Tax=Candidatus Neptunichlamydia vexilliferae TaxID=1651774 RepID=A0ABS0B062_9BACT|nr:ABC transporter permease [Candidatus Neptunochlamydia vexilliferae]MBF5059106.1 Oligopeptide transport system permease protein OppB [Candidatus Neptunochlamydia vexilliferae]